jgi:hypothetical protein
MKPISDFFEQELRWAHPKRLSNVYELRGGDEVLATVRLEGPFRSRALIETAEGGWTIVRKGLGQSITVVETGSHEELSTLKRGMSGKVTLILPDEQRFQWSCTSFWRDVWSWYTNEGTPLLHLTRGSRVQLEPAARELPEPELALLTTLGWYLHKLQEEDAAAASYVPVIS